MCASTRSGHHRPNGAGKSSMLNVINGVYHPQQGRITFRGKVRTSMDPHDAARRASPYVPEPRAVQGHERARQHHDGRNLRMLPASWRRRSTWLPRREELRHREFVEHIIDSSRSRPTARLRSASALWPAEACRPRARAGDEPKILLLDEPMAGMNLEESRTCRVRARRQREFGTTIVLIEHDMGVVMTSRPRCRARYGRKIGDGTPDEVRSNEQSSRLSWRGALSGHGPGVANPAEELAVVLMLVVMAVGAASRSHSA